MQINIKNLRNELSVNQRRILCALNFCFVVKADKRCAESKHYTPQAIPFRTDYNILRTYIVLVKQQISKYFTIDIDVASDVVHVPR